MSSLAFLQQPLVFSLPIRIRAQQRAEHAVPPAGSCNVFFLLSFGIQPQNESYAPPEDLFSLTLFFHQWLTSVFQKLLPLFLSSL